MHRTSGIDNPEAPISHHWLDSTHITFGVVTAGAVVNDWKFEASAFRGREPDQYRYDIERPALDSYAGRDAAAGRHARRLFDRSSAIPKPNVTMFMRAERVAETN